MKSDMAGLLSRLRCGLGLLLAACLVTASATQWPQAEPSVRQVLAPSGQLRVGLYPGTPTSILPDAGPGGARGVGHDLGREFARRLGIPFEPVIFPSNAALLEALKAGRVDVGFTNASTQRALDFDFTQPYLEIELGYLVRPGSDIATPAEVDRPGVRVGVTAKSSSDATLSRDLKQTSIVRAATVKAGQGLLAAGEIDVYATNKSTLFEMSEQLPGSRVLTGRWGVERHALALPKGREAGLPYARRFIDAAVAEGLVAAAVARAGLRGTVEAR